MGTVYSQIDAVLQAIGTWCAVFLAVWAVYASAAREQAEGPRIHRWFGTLFASYTLEGIGYIIAGTFLVAAIEQNSPGWIGGGAWVLVGLAAMPSAPSPG